MRKFEEYFKKTILPEKYKPIAEAYWRVALEFALSQEDSFLDQYAKPLCDSNKTILAVPSELIRKELEEE